MITPTVGRVVWFHPGPAAPHDPGTRLQPRAAIIAHVHDERLVNLMVVAPDGSPYGESAVPLLQDDDPVPTERFCEWMPFQKGQAAKGEGAPATS